ncbi:MAG: alpha/beta hydrolase [Bacteroidia bacterium]|nr:alpha/beta hydrolase [Bacteroidia bacterium]
MKHTKFFLSAAILMLMGFQAFALNPSRTYKQRPEKYNMNYEEVKVTTADGATLNVWDFPANKKTTNLVLIAHDGEGNMADYLRKVDQFTSIGINVVIFDYRGFGESSDFDIDNNMYIYPHFQDDMNAMIDYCRKAHVSTFNLYGFGIGAGLALGIGYNRPEVKRIIADTPFLSMEDLEERFSSWDEPMEVPFAGYDKKHEPIYSFDNNPAGNLELVKFIVGSNDVLFNENDYKGLIAKQKKICDKSVYVVENPDRKDNFMIDKSAYFKVVREALGIKE